MWDISPVSRSAGPGSVNIPRGERKAIGLSGEDQANLIAPVCRLTWTVSRPEKRGDGEAQINTRGQDKRGKSALVTRVVTSTGRSLSRVCCRFADLSGAKPPCECALRFFFQLKGEKQTNQPKKIQLQYENCFTPKINRMLLQWSVVPRFHRRYLWQLFAGE